MMESKHRPKPPADPDYSLERVPPDAREKRGFWSLFVIMLGYTFFSASMSVGAKLANGLDLSGFVWAVVIGGAILAAYTGLLGYVGSVTGLSMDLLARRSFGTVGSWLPSAMVSLTQIGWCGVGTAMFACPVSELLGINKWLLIALVGVCVTASAYFGIRSIAIVSSVSVPLIAILGIYSTVLATGDSGGWMELFGRSTGGMTVFTAVGMVVGSFISGGTGTPNFTRFSKKAWAAVATTVIAFFLGNSLMFIFGAVGGAYTGQEDIFYVMIAQGLTVPAIIVLGANIWTTNDNALYTSGLGLANITKRRKRPMTIVAGVVGTLAADWLYNNFVAWLSFLSATLPPVGAILVVDYFMRRQAYAPGAAPGRKVLPGSIAGVVAGALVAAFVNWGIAPINAMAVAVACYFIGGLATGLFKREAGGKRARAA